MGSGKISLFQIIFLLALALGVLTILFPTTIGLNLGYILIIGAIVAALGFAIFSLISNFKGAIKTLLGIAILIIIVLIAYGMSSGEAIMDAEGNVRATANVVRWAGAAIYGGMIVFAAGALTFIISEISSFFR